MNVLDFGSQAYGQAWCGPEDADVVCQVGIRDIHVICQDIPLEMLTRIDINGLKREVVDALRQLKREVHEV